MLLDELFERIDELGVSTDSPLVIHEPEVGFYTIECIEVTSYGQVRLQIQPSYNEEV